MGVMQSGIELNGMQMTVEIGHQAMMVINKILDIYVEADLAIWVRTDEFHMAHGIDLRLVVRLAARKPLPSWIRYMTK
jgi:hypothetical protein